MTDCQMAESESKPIHFEDNERITIDIRRSNNINET
jgi:hypothetical protein